MAIARNSVLTKPTNLSHLPGAVSTLEALAKVNDDNDLQKAIALGRVDPKMTETKAKALVVELNGSTARRSGPPRLRSSSPPPSSLGPSTWTPAPTRRRRSRRITTTPRTTTAWRRPGKGTMFLNPPHGEAGRWVSKLVAEFEEGNVTEAVALLPVSPDTLWFRQLSGYPLCLADHRLRLCESRNGQVSMAVYLGSPDRWEEFAKAFSGLGVMYAPYEPD